MIDYFFYSCMYSAQGWTLRPYSATSDAGKGLSSSSVCSAHKYGWISHGSVRSTADTLSKKIAKAVSSKGFNVSGTMTPSSSASPSLNSGNPASASTPYARCWSFKKNYTT